MEGINVVGIESGLLHRAEFRSALTLRRCWTGWKARPPRSLESRLGLEA